jgi:hypothetical protein
VDRTDRMETRADTREGMYNIEHWLAWLMALAALVLGAIGVLRGFGVLGDVAAEVGGEQTTGLLTGSAEFWDAIVWLLPAIAAGFLAHALHMTEHNRVPEARVGEGAGRMSSAPRSESGMYRFELLLSYLMALATLATAVLCMVVGFGLMSDTHTQFDGLLWGFLSIVYGTLTVTLHTVRHHQMVAEEDYLVALVEERVRSGIAYGSTPGTTETERGMPRS